MSRYSQRPKVLKAEWAMGGAVTKAENQAKSGKGEAREVLALRAAPGQSG
jgi:hypothetical protein